MSSLKDYAIAGSAVLALLFLMPLFKLLVLVDGYLSDSPQTGSDSS